MLLGPVFRRELNRMARRRRSYALRVCYLLVVLLLLWQGYARMLDATDQGATLLPARDLPRFALDTFTNFAVLQGVVVLLLVPLAFGGAIAEEKQSRTLHDLMTTQLSSLEIVLDKLAARGLHIGVYVALGLPVTCLLALFGGISPEYVVGAYLATASSAFFAAALALLVSTVARGLRSAVVVASLLVAGWVLVPVVADAIGRFVFPRLFRWVGPIHEWILSSTPAAPFYQTLNRGPLRGAPGPLSVGEALGWMVGLQLAGGLILLALTVWLLRPVFQRQQTEGRRTTWLSPRAWRPRWLQPPPCGSMPILWKEAYFARTDRFTKLVVLPATVLVSVVLAFGSKIDETGPRAVRGLLGRGYSGDLSNARASFHASLRDASAFYLGLWLLAAAGVSASCLTIERDEDTWTGLISTPLDGREIILGKLVGAAWGLRGFLAIPGLLWLAGLLTGAISVVGVLTALAVLALLTAFVMATGTLASLRARSGTRALLNTLAVILAPSAGLTLLAVPDGPHPDFVWLLCTPWLAAQAVLSPSAIEQFRQVLSASGSLGVALRVCLATEGLFAVALLGVYAVATVWLIRGGLVRFDQLVDRPRRTVVGAKAGARVRWGRRMALSAIITAAGTVLLVLTTRPDLRERYALHGTWKVIPQYGPGAPPVQLKHVTIDAWSGSIRLEGPDGAATTGVLKVDATTTPSRFDIRVDLPRGAVAANGWDGTIRGIYARRGERVWLCWIPGSNQRPAVVGIEAPPGAVAFVLTREK